MVSFELKQVVLNNETYNIQIESADIIKKFEAVTLW